MYNPEIFRYLPHCQLLHMQSELVLNIFFFNTDISPHVIYYHCTIIQGGARDSDSYVLASVS